MEFDKLKSLNTANVEKQQSLEDKTRKDIADIRNQEVLVKSIKSLAKFIEGHTTKTIILNQLRDYATSDDMESLGKFLRDILVETKKHENTDLTPVVAVLNDAVAELKSIPKEQLEISFPEQKDYTEVFKQLLEATKDSLAAIKAQKFDVEAPVVNVEAPNVQVEAPDLKPITEGLDKSFKAAVKAIVFPKLDVSEVVKEQQKTTKAVDKMRGVLEQLPLGGSGGGATTPRDDMGAVPTNDKPLATRLDDSATPILYIGKAPVGSSESAAVWQIAKLDTSSGLVKTWAGNAGFTQVWDDRTSLTYS